MNKDRAFHELVMLVYRARVFVWEQEETRNPVECGRQRAWLDAAHRLLKDTQSFVPSVEQLKQWEQERRVESGWKPNLTPNPVEG